MQTIFCNSMVFSMRVCKFHDWPNGLVSMCVAGFEGSNYILYNKINGSTPTICYILYNSISGVSLVVLRFLGNNTAM